MPRSRFFPQFRNEGKRRAGDRSIDPHASTRRLFLPLPNPTWTWTSFISYSFRTLSALLGGAAGSKGVVFTRPLHPESPGKRLERVGLPQARSLETEASSLSALFHLVWLLGYMRCRRCQGLLLEIPGFSAGGQSLGEDGVRQVQPLHSAPSLLKTAQGVFSEVLISISWFRGL